MTTLLLKYLEPEAPSYLFGATAMLDLVLCLFLCYVIASRSGRKD